MGERLIFGMLIGLHIWGRHIFGGGGRWGGGAYIQGAAYYTDFMVLEFSK